MKLCHRVLLWLAVATSLRLGPAPPGPALELGRARALRALGGGLVALPLLGNGGRGGAARARPTTRARTGPRGSRPRPRRASTRGS